MRPLALVCATLFAAAPAHARADCGDFRGLSEVLAISAGSLTGLVVSLASTVAINVVDPDATVAAPLLSGVVMGTLVTPALVFGVSTGAGCVPEEPLEVVALQISVSGSVALASSIAGHFVFRDRPVSVTYAPIEGGGGAVVLGGRF